MLKLMTLAVVFDALKAGTIKMDDMLTVSDNADYKNPVWADASKICLSAGQQISVRDAILGLIVLSGGDAGVVLSEKLAGSEGDMTVQMLKKARSIGMNTSSFGNVTGLPSPDNLMTSRELATLAEYMIREYPEYYPMFATRRFEYKDYQDGWCQQWGQSHTINYNKLLFIMPGSDGLKTGHTAKGGYGVVASAKRGGRRLIAVINGLRVNDHNALATEAKKILEWGFANTKNRTFFKAGDVVAKIPVWYGKDDVVEGAAGQNIVITLKDGQDIANIRVLARYNEPVSAPIKAGDKIGEIIIEEDGMTTSKYPIVAKTDVRKTQFIGRIIKNLSVIFTGK
jgi:D-alanyl-D-alanine carboxypeptidase (penicillin-binding protein 5/6)